MLYTTQCVEMFDCCFYAFVVYLWRKNLRRGHLNIIIDDLTPCLTDKFGNQYDTVAHRVTDVTELKGFTRKTGWFVNWTGLFKKYKIYALALKDAPTDIQGLVAVEDRYYAGATIIHWAVSAPHNNPLLCDERRYFGVGGHLFAIALHSSIEAGFGGVVIGHPTNRKLLEHYITHLGAEAFDYSFFAENYQYTIVLEGEKAREVYEKYTFSMD